MWDVYGIRPPMYHSHHPDTARSKARSFEDFAKQDRCSDLGITSGTAETLEQRLAESQNNFMPDIETIGLCLDESFRDSPDSLFDMGHAYLPSHIFSTTNTLPDPPNPLPEPTNLLPDPLSALPEPATTLPSPMHQITVPINSVSAIDTGNTVASPRLATGLSNSSLDPRSDCVISDFLRTDLNQLYFERVQHSVPILHRRTYFSWARSPIKSESQVCLQYAMWTIAASLASQLQDIRESLYQCTQKLLESLEWKDDIFVNIEHVQARLLICVYELMRTNHQRSWMSAGRCFRLIQLMRLHEVDGPDNVALRKNAPSAEDWVRQEEKRRAFWMAYSLDLFISVRGKWPLTLHEHITTACLPAPEENFQNGNYVEMLCLSDPTNSLEQSERSPFTESVILASMCKHLAVHRLRSATDRMQDNARQAFWDRHNWLNEMIKTRVGQLSINYPTSLQYSDPMLLFATMMAHAMVLCLCNIMESVHWETHDYQNAVATFRHRSLLAARNITSLSRSLAQWSYLKVHPFTPLPLRICVEFFNAHRYLDESTSSQVQELYDSLREMGSVNNLAQDYLLA
ncbi:hypothetical protein MMC13_002034 [Lambiella insularis]|nr:hypothetical protein [Lambiella insularis]